MKLGKTKISQAIKMMKETGKIDSSVGAKNIGLILDHHNQLVEKKKDETFEKEVTARNKYFWKLWKGAIRDMQSGVRPKKNVFRLKPRTFLGRTGGVN